MKTFESLRERILDLYGNKRYEEALSLVQANFASFPDHRATVNYWIACFLALVGKRDEAIASLESGLTEGSWWAEPVLRGDRDLVDPVVATLPEVDRRVREPMEGVRGRGWAARRHPCRPRGESKVGRIAGRRGSGERGRGSVASGVHPGLHDRRAGAWSVHQLGPRRPQLV
jgi:hypothetical protein